MGDVREGLTDLFGWLTRPRKEIVATAKRAFSAAANDLMGDSDEKVVEYLRGRGFTKAISEQAVEYAHARWEGKKLNRFNIVSGVTYAAQKLAPDSRYEVETMAGELVTA